MKKSRCILWARKYGNLKGNKMICFLFIHFCSLGVSHRTLLHDRLHVEFRSMCLILNLCGSSWWWWWWWLCNISIWVWHWFY